MTRPRILSQPPARTHAERTMVLSTLSRVSNDPMYEHLAECGRTMDTDMLMSALKEGVFKVPMDIGMNTDHLAKSTELYLDSTLVEKTTPMVLHSFSSVFSVFENVSADAIDEDENGNDLREIVSVAKLYASDAFSEFYVELVKGFLEDRKAVLEHGDHLGSESTEITKDREATAKRVFRDTAVGLMALACALDKPEELQLLLKLVPGAIETLGSADYAGSCVAEGLQMMGNSNPEQQNCRFTVPFFAIHYSSEPCLDALLQAGWKGHQPFAFFKCEDPSRTPEGGGDDPLKAWNPRTSACGLNLADLLDEDAVFFSPAMMTKAISAMKDEAGQWRASDRHALCANTRDRMDTDNNLSYGYLLPILKTDLLDWEIAQTLETAAENGSLEVFEKYADRMPWSELLHPEEPTILELALRSKMNEEHPEHHCSLAMTIVRSALQDGETRIFDLRVDEQGSVTPLERVIDLNYVPVVLEFLKDGLRQDTPIEGTQKTLRSILEAAGNESLTHMVQTFEARQRALSALAEIEAEATSSPAP